MKSIKKMSIALTLAVACGITTIAASGVTAFAATSSTSKTLTRAEAVKQAQTKAKGTLLKTELDYDNGRLVYEIDILDSANVEHEMDVNATTGKITSYSKKTLRKAKAEKLRSAKISHDKAISIAQKEAGGTTTLVLSELDVENNQLVYEVKLVDSKNTYLEYEVVINATDGTVLFFESDYDD